MNMEVGRYDSQEVAAWAREVVRGEEAGES